jgi:hypothetical protein
MVSEQADIPVAPPAEIMDVRKQRREIQGMLVTFIEVLGRILSAGRESQ